MEPIDKHLSGIVVHGQQLGRRLGYPTANIDTSRIVGEVPQPGVYAAWATLTDGTRYKAMVNVGYRPTVSAAGTRVLTVEAHLADYTGDLYGQQLSLHIVARIRDERRMDSLDQLRSQLGLDLSEVRKLEC